MAKKIDYYEDFLRTEEVKEKISQKEKVSKIGFSLIALLVTLSAFIFSIKGSSFPVLLTNNQNDEIVKINSRIDELTKDLDNISTSVKNNNEPSFVYLNSKIQNIEQKNSYLYDTILKNPDSAITPKILREEQDNINEKINDLKSQITKTNSLLSAIFIALLIGIVSFIGKQIWDTWFRKKTY